MNPHKKIKESVAITWGAHAIKDDSIFFRSTVQIKMKAYLIAIIVCLSVAAASLFVCVLCKAGRKKKTKSPTVTRPSSNYAYPDVERGVKKSGTRDGGMVILAGATAAVVATAVTAAAVSSSGGGGGDGGGGGGCGGGGCGGGGCGGGRTRLHKVSHYLAPVQKDVGMQPLQDQVVNVSCLQQEERPKHQSVAQLALN
ncbi:hypothetical protein RJ640_006521 [Escallonia rubra]|uniref:Uncharacterized protein n=1 Tax=Escallonia rubra TaxID=112253 RepID=A0AA88U3S9_9ASTE|nr:hypothetical protein RJ640_006521 [Escallonia rubra]